MRKPIALERHRRPARGGQEVAHGCQRVRFGWLTAPQGICRDAVAATVPRGGPGRSGPGSRCKVRPAGGEATGDVGKLDARAHARPHDPTSGRVRGARRDAPDFLAVRRRAHLGTLTESASRTRSGRDGATAAPSRRPKIRTRHGALPSRLAHAHSAWSAHPEGALPSERFRPRQPRSSQMRGHLLRHTRHHEPHYLRISVKTPEVGRAVSPPERSRALARW